MLRYWELVGTFDKSPVHPKPVDLKTLQQCEVHLHKAQVEGRWEAASSAARRLLALSSRGETGQPWDPLTKRVILDGVHATQETSKRAIASMSAINIPNPTAAGAATSFSSSHSDPTAPDFSGLQKFKSLSWMLHVPSPQPLSIKPQEELQVDDCRRGNGRRVEGTQVKSDCHQTLFMTSEKRNVFPVTPSGVLTSADGGAYKAVPPQVALEGAMPQQRHAAPITAPLHPLMRHGAPPAAPNGSNTATAQKQLSSGFKPPSLKAVDSSLEVVPPPPVSAPAKRLNLLPAPVHAAPRPAAPQAPPLPSAPPPSSGFVTAAQQLDSDIKQGKCSPSFGASMQNKPVLGLRRQGFNPPLQSNASTAGQEVQQPPSGGVGINKVMSTAVNSNSKPQQKGEQGDDERDPSQYPPSLLLPDGSVPPILLPLDPKLVTQITYEIMEKQTNVDWSDIAGLEHAKSSVEEAIVWPLRRPDLFVGLRDPPRGLLLFGPPGTGKTMIARAIAGRASCTFLNISSSSLMSKWIGDGEKMVRCMFAVAVVKQPSVIFIDEIDSLLSMRGEGEQDAVRRVKTEFLVQLDGVGTSAADRVLLIGATNRPDELDEAARRRMEKRLYIPLPDAAARIQLVHNLISKGNFSHEIQRSDLEEIARLTEGYSGADLKSLCREAAMGPLRSAKGNLLDVAVAEIRAVSAKDFLSAVKRVKPSVGQGELERYDKWNSQYGTFLEDGDEDAEED